MTLRITQARLEPTLGSTLRITQARLQAVNQTLRITQAKLVGIGAVAEVATFPQQTVDPFSTVIITGKPLDPTLPPDSYQFTVLTGGVTLTGTGASRSFVAPAHSTTFTVTVRVQGVKGGTTSTGKVATININPWDKWVWNGTAWVPLGPVKMQPHS